MARPFGLMLVVVAAIGGCDLFPGLDRFPPGVDLSKRQSIPVDAETDAVLNEWQNRRANTKSFYATFKQTVESKALKTTDVRTGVMRYRHSDVYRLDYKSPREVLLCTKGGEIWCLNGVQRKAQVYVVEGPNVLQLAASALFWFAPTEKSTVQKHGSIRKIKDHGQSVELRVVNSKHDSDHSYEWMNATLRKSDYLPVQLEIKEDAVTVVTWEFTDVHENVEFGESDFVPPKLGDDWQITRQRLLTANEKPKPPAKDKKESKAAKPNAP